MTYVDLAEQAAQVNDTVSSQWVYVTSVPHTCIERLTKFPCCACPASCLACGNADKRKKFQDEELGTALICQKPTVGGHQHYLSSVLCPFCYKTFPLQNIFICWGWFLKGICILDLGFWNFPCLPSTEEIGSNTHSASCAVLHRDFQDESSHHQHVLPSILVKAVLTSLLVIRQKKMGICWLQLDLTSLSSSHKSSLHIFSLYHLLENGKTSTPGACVHPLIFSWDLSTGSLASTGQAKSLKPICAHPRQESNPSPYPASHTSVEVPQTRSEKKGSICLDSFDQDT